MTTANDTTPPANGAKRARLLVVALVLIGGGYLVWRNARTPEIGRAHV